MKPKFLAIALIFLAACSKDDPAPDPTVIIPKDTTKTLVPEYPKTEIYDGQYSQFEDGYPAFGGELMSDTVMPATAVVIWKSATSISIRMNIWTIFHARPGSHEVTDPGPGVFDRELRLESVSNTYVVRGNYEEITATFPKDTDSLMLFDSYAHFEAFVANNRFRGKKRK